MAHHKIDPWSDKAPQPVRAFLLYVGSVYYPSQGVLDIVHTADTAEELRAVIPDYYQPDNYQWWEIVDHTTMRCIDDNNDAEG